MELTKREDPAPSLVPQKRILEDDIPQPTHSLKTPPVNKDTETFQREKREKKESLKKRESKGVTPDLTKGPHDNLSKLTSKPLSKSGNSSIKPIRYLFPKPVPADYNNPPAPTLLLHHVKPKLSAEDSETAFYEPERVSNRKGYRFSPCIADHNFPATVFRKTEIPPQRARLSLQDASSSILFDRAITQASTDKGYRLARANIAAREGRWYWECRITSGIAGAARRERAISSSTAATSLESNGHVRVGWARLEASFEAPVGYDAYSYGIRDVAGQRVHMSRPADFFPSDTSIVEGDIIGLEINLPSLALHQKVVTGNYNPAVDLESSTEPLPPQPKGFHIIRDRALCPWKSNKYFEQFEYCSTKELEDLCHPTNDQSTRTAPNPTHPNPILRTLPGSSIRIYRNGELVGEPFQGLLAFLPPASKPGAVEAREGMDDGCLGYYPAISCFRGGAVEVNFGPKFWAPPLESKNFRDDDHTSNTLDGAPTSPSLISNAASEKPNRPLRPLSERYAEQIAEDTVHDIIDEVELALNPPEGLSRLASTGISSSDAKKSTDNSALSKAID